MKQLKRGLAFLLVVVMMVSSMGVGALAAPAKTQKAAIKTVTITKPDTKTLVMKKGKTFTLKTKVTTTGKGKISKAVTYSSSNKKVATVSSKGKIKALKNGKTTITVTSKANKNKKSTLKVIVKTPVTKVALDKKTLELTEGETAALKATVSPKDATVKKVAFTSSKPEVVKVDSKGNLTALKEGTAVITAKATDGNGKKATCTVKVTKKAEEQKPVEPEKPAEPQKPEDAQKPGDSQDNGGTTDPEKPVDPTEPANPEEPVDELSYEGFELKWEDDFDSVSLNSADWNVELHEPGWVNAEWQEYVDSEENIYIEDGNLVIKPVRTQTGVDENGAPVYKYTSGRVNTQGKHDFTYGLFETRVKVPTGKGYLPAFWMMPTDENLYGQWPRCGEIDIMEVMGDDIKKAYGTLHYGNPHGQSQGTKVLTQGDYSGEYHTFAVEWEPGKIVWYVDGVKYHEASDWYTTTEGQGTAAYPAPFDQPFYMILNLAIGGSWVGYPDETTTYEDQAFTIDYVRAYQKSQEYYDHLEETAEKPVKPEVVEPADGIYVNNGNFAIADNLTGKNGSVWEFMTQKGGEAEAVIINDDTFGVGANAVKISTTDAGTEDYAVQFVQANIPVKQGGQYRVSFDAYAASERTMLVDVSAPDYNYARYLNDTKVELTTAKKSYSYEFTVTDHDDANARLEFNLGKTSPISDVYISNIMIEKIGTVEIDNSKKVLTDGNYVSNGKFQEGTETGKKYMQYWDVITDGDAQADAVVTNLEDGRRMKITSSDCASENYVVLQQTELPLTAGKYQLSFDAQADKACAIRVNVAGQTFEAELAEDKKDYVYKFEIPESAKIPDIDDIVFEVGVNGTVLLDNVRIVEDTLIKNGSFNADLAGFEVYAYTPGDVSYTVDSQNEDKAFDITIKNTNDADWKIQLKQNNVTLEKDQWYNLKFDVKSSIDREISYAIQRNGAVHKDAAGNEDWTPYVQNVVELPAYSENGEYQTVSVDFQMKYATDEGSIFNIAMGGGDNTTQHRICIDDIILEKIDDPSLVKTDAQWTMNGGTMTEEDGIIQCAITEEASKENLWDIQLQNNGYQFSKDKKYEVRVVASSTDTRTIEVGVQKDDPQKSYGSKTIEINGTEQEIKVPIAVDEDGLTLDTYIKMCNPSSGASTENPVVLTFKDLNVYEVTEEEEEPIVPAEYDVNLVDDDLSNDQWIKNTTNDDAQSSAVVNQDNKKEIAYTITNLGETEHAIELVNKPIQAEKGETYEVSFDITSSVGRDVIAKLQHDGSVDNNWGAADWSKTIALVSNETKHVVETYCFKADDRNELFAIDLGKIGDLATDTVHTITIANVCIKKIRVTEDPEQPTVAGNLLVNADFTSGTDSWYINGADLSASDGKAVCNITREGENRWDIQFAQNGLTLTKGKKYEVSFTAESTDDRNITVALQGGEDTDWAQYYNSDNGTDNIVLTANISKEICVTFTMEQDTDAAVTFAINMSDGTKAEKVNTLQFSNLSVKEVAK